MNRQALHHHPDEPYAAYDPDGTLTVRLQTAKGDLEQVTVYSGDRFAPEARDQWQPMHRAGRDADYDWWEATLSVPGGRYRYTFCLEDGYNACWLAEEGLSQSRPRPEHWFHLPYVWKDTARRLPEWSQTPVYHIFVDRFANGDPTNDPPGTTAWGALPTPQSFHGGDLQGILERVPYLEELGFGILCLTPIFTSPSNHKYDTTDYEQIDPAFGDRATLARLVETCHKRGIKVVLDAVFNHAGSNWAPFQDVVAKGQASPYADWFHIWSFPIQSDPPNYETFATGIGTMPKLNTGHPAVQEYLCGVASAWTRDFGIDGWRLDVGNELHPGFIRRLRESLQAVGEDMLLVGEAWMDARPFLRGDQWDTTTHYPWRSAVLDFCTGRKSAPELANRLQTLFFRHSSTQSHALWNLLGSHDTERLLTACKGSTPAALLAFTLQATWPGTPVVYYGDEVGMPGNNDPDCRRCLTRDVETAGAPLRAALQPLLHLRRNSPALRHGRTVILLADPATNLWSHLRWSSEDAVITVLNNSPHRVTWAANSGSLPPSVPPTLSLGRVLGGCSGEAPGEGKPASIPTIAYKGRNPLTPRIWGNLVTRFTDYEGLAPYDGLVIHSQPDGCQTHQLSQAAPSRFR